MRNSFFATCVVSMSLLGPIALFGQEVLTPLRIDTPPTIDAVLDEPFWAEAPFVTGFKSFVPDFQKDMGHRTEVYMAYDEQNFYFAFKVFDDPDKIKTSLAARDRIRDDDWVCINLDTFDDQQSLNTFYINPNGIQMDAKYAANQEDVGIDLIWYSAGAINDEGYIIEVRIPFKSIRYRNQDVVRMGVIFERKISRYSMQGTYPAMDPEMGFNFLNQTAKLDFEDIQKFTLLEVLPSVTYANRSVHQEGQMQNVVNRGDVGVSLKYGLTSDLILDATVNPDFSQVESDVGQVDINQRFPIYFPERRPFFLEGNENFNFAQTGGGDGVRSVVNTRTIVDPLVAGKLTGKIGGARNTVAAIYALDELPNDLALDGDRNAQVGVLRYKRTLKTDSYVGGVVTSRDRNTYYNRVAGADAQIRVSKSSTLEGNYLHSWTQDSASAEVVSAHSTKIGYSKSNRASDYGASIADIGNFRSDVGFVTRTEMTRANVYYVPKIYFNHSFLTRFEPFLWVTYILDKPSNMVEYSYFLNLRLNMERNSRLSASINLKDEVYRAQKFNHNGFEISARSQITKRIYFNVSYEYLGKTFYSDNPYQGDGANVEVEAVFQVNDNFNSEWLYTFSNFKERATGENKYDYSIYRSKNTYQINKYLFVRLILQYNAFYEQLNGDFLFSFTYIPGTVVHLGYGSIYNNTKWEINQYVPGDRLIETSRGFFFKASYLFRK